MKGFDGGCTYFSKFSFEIVRLIDAALSTIIPFLGIIVGNRIMIYSLWRASRQRQHMTDSTCNIHKITVMCICSSLCFVLSTAPNRIYLMAHNIGLYDDL